MSDHFSGIQLDRPKVLHRQIRDQVRELILSQKLKPGQRIPTTQELASLFQANVCTVHNALTPLVKEGLLVRYPRKGTFVRQREEKLACVGIYCRADFWAIPEAAFQRAIFAALQEELKRLGIKARVWIDTRLESEHFQPWMELCRAAEHREIQGLVSGGIDPGLVQWQNRLPVPFAFLGSTDCPNAVVHDLRQLAELGLRALAEQGCRSVGLVMPISSNLESNTGFGHDMMGFFECFVNLARDLNLTLRDPWMRLPASNATAGRRSQERFGYEEFLQLWEQPERPEGLVVFPDATARGVILGLREKQVRVPDELKLVFHKNEAVELLCPMPATFVVTSEREAARALIQQIQKQFRGERCAPISVGCQRSP